MPLQQIVSDIWHRNSLNWSGPRPLYFQRGSLQKVYPEIWGLGDPGQPSEELDVAEARSGQLAKSRYNLPEVLQILRVRIGATRQDLAQFIYDRALRLVCFPYTHDPNHLVEIEPSQLKREWPDPWSFPVFYEHLGDLPMSDLAEETKVPLLLVADAVDGLLRDSNKNRIRGEDGRPIVTSAVVYVLHEDLAEFLNGRRNLTPKGLSSAGRSKGGKAGSGGNKWLREAIERIAEMLEADGTPPTSGTVWKWLCENASAENPYAFEPPIAGCDFLQVDGEELHFRDQSGNPGKRHRRSLERYKPEKVAASC